MFSWMLCITVPYLYSNGLHSYGLYSCGLYSYDLYSYGLYSWIFASPCRTYHIDMRMDVRIDMRVDIRTDMRTDIRTDMRIYRRNDISLDAVAAHNFEGSRRGLGERRWLVFFRFFSSETHRAQHPALDNASAIADVLSTFFCWRRRAGMAAGVGAGCCAPPWSFPPQHIRQPSVLATRQHESVQVIYRSFMGY